THSETCRLLPGRLAHWGGLFHLLKPATSPFEGIPSNSGTRTEPCQRAVGRENRSAEATGPERHTLRPLVFLQIRLLQAGCCRTTAFACRAGCKDRDISNNRHAGPVKCTAWFAGAHLARP